MPSRTMLAGMNKLIASQLASPSLLLQHFDQINDQAYALIFTASVAKDFTFDDYNTAFSQLTANTLSLQPGTLLEIETNKAPMFRCVARTNTESKTYTEDSVKGMKAIRANVFLDDDDKTIWKLEGEGDNKRLIRVTQQAYDTILESKRTRSPVLSSVSDVVSYEVGDYAYFYNHQTNLMDFGYVLAFDNKEYVLTRKTCELVELKTPGQVVIAHNPRENDKNINKKRRDMTIAREYSMDGYLEFLKKLYGADSEYYKAVERNIKEYMMD